MSESEQIGSITRRVFVEIEERIVRNADRHGSGRHRSKDTGEHAGRATAPGSRVRRREGAE